MASGRRSKSPKSILKIGCVSELGGGRPRSVGVGVETGFENCNHVKTELQCHITDAVTFALDYALPPELPPRSGAPGSPRGRQGASEARERALGLPRP